MKPERIATVLGIAGLLILGLVILTRRPNVDEKPIEMPVVVPAAAPVAEPIYVESNRAPMPVPVAVTNHFPDDSRPEVQLLYQLTTVANFYNFNPEIIYYRSNARPRMIDLGTPTHGVSIMGGVVYSLHSYYDGSDTRRRPEVAKEWYRCTGKWSEQEAIAETLRILGALGNQSALAQVAEGAQSPEGKPECHAQEYTMPGSDGQPVKVTPFYRVQLKNKEGRRIVDVEYRIGTNGPVGLVDWYFWP